MTSERNLAGACRALAAGLAWGLALVAPAEAATFGVPTNLAVTGEVCTAPGAPHASCTAASVNPPGFFILTGSTDNANGDTVHEIRFFIEVTGTTLDVKVFDAGRNGARDVTQGGTNVQYRLIPPTGADLATFVIGGDTGTTDNRLARLTAGGAGFVAANAGAAFAGLNAGLYELRVEVQNNSTVRNAFGVDIRDGSGNHYNVFTVGDSTAPDSAFVAGAYNGAAAPPANIVEPMPLFAYVDRGCSVNASNYHMESTSAAGAGSSASLVDALGTTRALTLSNTTAVSDVVTVESTGGVNQEATNYGMWPLTNDVGTQQNIVDWRFADYQGWTTAPGALPGDPVSAIRMYLPNGYAPVTGNPNAVAPVEPILQSVFRVVSGANPPQPGVVTRYELASSLFNTGPGTLSTAVLRIPLVAGAALVAGTAAATVDGLPAACTEAGGVPGVVGGAVQCTFVPTVAVSSVASLVIRVDYTPAAAGVFNLTGDPTTSPLGGTLYAQFAPPSSSATFPRTQTIGPLCQLAAFATAQVDLRVQKTDAPDPVSAGADLTYTIVVTNDGTTTAPNVSLGETVPAGTTFQSLSVPAGWSCATPAVGGTGAINCGNPSFAAAASSTFTYVVRVAPGLAAGTTLSNTADVSSAGTEITPANNVATAQTTTQVSADIGVTKSDSPDPVQAGADLTYTITVTNNGPSHAGAVTLTDAVPTNTTFQAVSVPSGWTCPTVPAVGGTGTLSCNVASLAVGASARIGIVVRLNTPLPAITVISNTAAVASANDPVAGNNSATATTILAAASVAPRCATGIDGAGGTLAGIVNTYYPGTATATAGSTSITLGPARGAAATINPGDLLLVILMQDAAIDSSNDERYGDGTGTAGNTTGNGSGSTNQSNVGRFEYVVATSAMGAGGGTLNVATGLANTYTDAAASGTQGQRRFQVVRIPQYTTATLGNTLTAAAWNGTTGGILGFDVAGGLSLGGATVSVSGLGFRGGQGRALAGGGGTGVDYRNTAVNGAHGQKGEGIAGTPRYVWSTGGGPVDTGVDGYPNGSSARGAPGNAGGGGTDTNPAVNDQNSGGGGGGNAGAGGRGGNAWLSQGPVGGWGGAAFPGAFNRLILGGGGGAGTRNNSSAELSSGGPGGGMVMVRAGSVTGAGTINADGQTGLTPLNDGGGGGGAGGSVLVLAQTGGLAGLTVTARGGAGTNAWPTQPPNGTPGERHGPGGGGGGGLVVLSSAPATAPVVTGGANGTTTTVADAFGALPGAIGATVIDATAAGVLPVSCPVADLALTMTDSPDPALVSGLITYTIVATNSYLTATSATITDTLPAGLTFVSASSTRGTCAFASPTVTCSLGTLASGASATVTLVVTPTATGTITNTASVASTEVQLTSANNTASASTTVNPAADLSVSKSATPDPVVAGQDVTWTIVVQNAGPNPAVNATLSEAIPANTTFQSLAPAAGWTCSGVPVVGGTGSFSCVTSSLAAGASASFTLVVRVGAGTAPGTVITNTASVSSTTADPDASDNSASAFVNVDAPVALLTRATIRGLRVDRAGQIEFATGTQKGTRYFNLLASDDPSGRGELVLLNDEPVRAAVSDSRSPILYEVRTAPVTSRYVFVEETERSGRRHLLGPFEVGDARLARAYARVAQRLAAAGDQQGVAAGAWRTRMLAPAAERQKRALAGPLGLARTTRYIGEPGAIPGPTGAAALRSIARERAAAGTILPRSLPPVREARTGIKIEVIEPGIVRLARAELVAAGLPPRMPLRRLQVTNLGSPVASQVENAGTPAETLVFRARPLSTTYTGRNVYVATWGGLPTVRTPLTLEEPPPADGITRVSKRLVYAPDAVGTDPWVWDVLFSDGPTWPESSWDAAAGTFDLPGLLPDPGAVPVRLVVVGASEDRHVVEAWLNGQWLGRVSFEGHATGVIEGLATGLLAEANQLSLSYTTEDGSLDGMALLAHLDVAAPLAPSEASATAELSPFVPTLPSLRGAQYLIVTHADFLPAARRLATLKQREGLLAAVVDVERAYDHFSAGVVEAQAVRALIAQAAAGKRLRYVLLFGDDTYDPRGFSGLGEVSYVPSLYADDGAYGRVPSENRYADVDGDGRPDLALGRLPARSAEEADALVTKIAGQAAALRAGTGRQVFAVDNVSPGDVSFRDEARVAAAQVASGASVTWADIGSGIIDARSALATGLAQGASLVHYFGHGGPETWADESLLAVEDVDGLAGPGSVVLTWACQVQDYQYIFGRSVNESLVLKPSGGALASFGPAGISDFAAQAAFYERLYDVLVRRGMTLGEAIRQAKATALARDPRVLPVVEGFNLLGDPALVLDPAPRNQAER